MSFTLQQILALAPDEASAKAGMQLATPQKWLVRSTHPLALWGDCQGSGSRPYRTYIDIKNIAFKCSCPSRKFPCKHGLGLFLLYADKPELFSSETALPPDLEEWISKRAMKAETKEASDKKPVDEGVQQKRVDAREKKVIAGINELQVWIKDIVRTGIFTIPQNSHWFASTITARMVDSQAPGLAYQLKKLEEVNFYKEGWQQSLISLLSRIYLLTEAYKRNGSVGVSLKEDLHSLIGWTIPKEDILKTAAIHDEWLVLSTVQQQDGNLTSESTWFFGKNTRRFAVQLHYYTSVTKPLVVYLTGRYIDADLVFYPGTYPLRCLLHTQRSQLSDLPEIPDTHTSIESVKDHVAEILMQAPFTEVIPLLISEMVVVQSGSWFLKDPAGKALHVLNTEEECWEILALTKGAVFTCFALYKNETMDVHSLWIDKAFYTIK